MREVWIRGAAMTRFGRQLERTARELVEEAVAASLADAEVAPEDVGAVYVGNAAAGLMSGQECIRAQVVLRHTGLMGVPIVNVENACASSSSALHLAWQAVAGGIHDCVVVVGYEKLADEDRSKSIRAINAAMDLTELVDVFGADPGRERNVFMDLHGATSTGEGRDRFDREALALISVKNHHHGSLNPYAHHGQEVTVEQVLASRPVAGPLTVLMCSPFSDGAACVVLAARGLRRGDPDVRVAASALTSGRGDDLRRPNATRRAARQAYERAGVGPDDLDLVELHDATAVSELYLYEELGLCPRGESVRLARDRATWLGGRLPVNTSGGLISRGDPIGATGVAQVVELTWQLRGRCGARQVPDARIGLAQSAGGWVGTDVAACAIHILQR
jgi:acetyl-CoA acetyltransferase